MSNVNAVITKHQPRPLEELDLMDDFLFQELLMQERDGEEFCRILLSTILGKQIRNVRIIPQKNILGIDTNRHGIRMDAYIEDISEGNIVSGAEVFDAQVAPDIYDIEPNKRYEKQTLPKRMRYWEKTAWYIPYGISVKKILQYHTMMERGKFFCTQKEGKEILVRNYRIC